MQRRVVLSLDETRESLRVPTCFVSCLAALAGGTVTVRYPGFLVAFLPDGETVAEIRVRVVDVHQKDAEVRRELAVEQQTKSRT